MALLGWEAVTRLSASWRGMWFLPICPLLPSYGTKMELGVAGVSVGREGQRADIGGAECQPGPWAEHGLGASLL